MVSTSCRVAIGWATQQCDVALVMVRKFQVAKSDVEGLLGLFTRQVMGLRWDERMTGLWRGDKMLKDGYAGKRKRGRFASR